MKTICLALINFYQRFISPRKGFCCAHHQLHKGQTCSNAIKFIIRDNSFGTWLPLINARFQACKNASHVLASQRLNLHHQADLPCDCGSEIFSPTDSSACAGDLPCDLCFDWPQMKRRTRRIVMFIAVLIAIVFAYLYGSKITKIELTQLTKSQRSDGLIQKLISREAPSLRVLVVSDGHKVYSSTALIKELNSDKGITLKFDKAISLDNVSALEVHDARLSIAKDTFVLGQVLEEFEQPRKSGEGKRFKYKFKARWSLF